MTRAVVIINPLSGHGRYENQIRDHAALAREVLGTHQIDAEVRPTTGPGDARLFARDAVESGASLVIAWGGDGTVNEAASAARRRCSRRSRWASASARGRSRR